MKQVKQTPKVPDWTEEQHEAARKKHRQEIREREKQIVKNNESKFVFKDEMERLASELGIEGLVTVIMYCKRRGNNE